MQVLCSPHVRFMVSCSHVCLSYCFGGMGISKEACMLQEVRNKEPREAAGCIGQIELGM